MFQAPVIKRRPQYTVREIVESGRFANYFQNNNIFTYTVVNKNFSAKDIRDVIHQIYLNLTEDDEQGQGPVNPSFVLNLNISENAIGSLGCRYILATDLNKFIHTLILRQCQLQDSSVQELLRLEPQLQQLSLEKNQLTDRGCQYLSQGRWPHLLKVNLSHNHIADRGCKHLIQANWGLLERLNIALNKIKEPGCRYLSKNRWDKLQELNLCLNSITNKACSYIISAHLPSLRKLHLSSNELLTEKACQELSKGSWSFQQIQKISLKYCRIYDQGQQFMNEKYPRGVMQYHQIITIDMI